MVNYKERRLDRTFAGAMGGQPWVGPDLAQVWWTRLKEHTCSEGGVRWNASLARSTAGSSSSRRSDWRQSMRDRRRRLRVSWAYESTCCATGAWSSNGRSASLPPEWEQS